MKHIGEGGSEIFSNPGDLRSALTHQGFWSFARLDRWSGPFRGLGYRHLQVYAV